MAGGAGTKERLARLRAELAGRELDGFIVPRADEHQGEYVPPSAQRLEWISGFSGSAGVAIVLADQAALFTDGRYTLQAAAEVDGASFRLLHLVDEPPMEWLARTLTRDSRFGYDPWLHTPEGVDKLRAACEKTGARLIPCADNPLDKVWRDRPAPPLAQIVAHPELYAGRGSAEKRAQIGAALAAESEDAVILTAPDSIAWLLNIRGGDVPFSPMPLSFAIAAADGSVDLFADPRKYAPGLVSHLGEQVALRPMTGFAPALAGLKGRKVRLDFASAPAWVLDHLSDAGAKPVRGIDPCQLPKACKNPIEIEGMRRAHRRDGVALARFLAWFSAEAPHGGLDEIGVADRLEAFRALGEHHRGPSFPTIAGAGPNGAIIHYRALPETRRTLEPGQIFLLDSGAQYLDGTTDVTRTLAVGPAPAEARRNATLVLKGHIALGRARFPEGTTGSQLDVLARAPLWSEGLDFDHGTGHGVGSYLSVHEGPQRISKAPNTQALKVGMVISNEPGYYRQGAYGIRIENLIAVHQSAGAGDRPMLEFETLTLAPYDRALIDPGLLDAEERDWIDSYHHRVRHELLPLLDSATGDWLTHATRPLGVG